MAKLNPDIRNKILDAASRIFAKYGIKKTTIEDIAGAMKMGKSSLYYYFKSKEEIFKAVIHREVDEFGARVRGSLQKCSSPQEKLRTFAVNRMQYLNELTNAYTALKDEYVTEYAFIQELRADYDKREKELLKSIFKEGTQAGLFEIADIGMTADVLATSLKGFEYEWFIKEKSAPDIEERIDAMLNIFYYGILK
jgi:AcrR family transcriptional regulator